MDYICWWPPYAICSPKNNTKPVLGLDVANDLMIGRFWDPNHSVDVWKDLEVHRERPQTPSPDWWPFQSWQAMENISTSKHIWKHNMQMGQILQAFRGTSRESLFTSLGQFSTELWSFSGRALFRDEWFLHFIYYSYILIYHTSRNQWYLIIMYTVTFTSLKTKTFLGFPLQAIARWWWLAGWCFTVFWRDTLNLYHSPQKLFPRIGA